MVAPLPDGHKLPKSKRNFPKSKNKNKNGGFPNPPPQPRGPASDPSKHKPGKPQKLSGALNPAFDPRMRRVGSPLNRSTDIRRGWIQTGPNADANQRINFLFNPPEVDLNSSVDPNQSRSDAQVPPDDTAGVYQTGSGTSLALSLLYDRTYEMFSKPGGGTKAGIANRYGVYVDVAAWYYYHKMIDDIPTALDGWNRSLITQPMTLVDSYIFIGQNMVYYGFVNAISVAYTHWSQTMVPIRCKIDLSFSVLPTSRIQGGPNSPPAQAASAVTKIASSWIDGLFDTPTNTPSTKTPIPKPTPIPGNR